MTISVVQSVIGSTASNAGSFTTGALNTSASNGFLIIVGTLSTGSTITASDSKGNTYTSGGAQISDGSGRCLNVFASPGGAGGSGHTFSAASSGTPAWAVIGVEIAGMPASGFWDSNASNSTSGFQSTPYSTGSTASLAAPSSGELLLSICMSELFSASVPYTPNQSGSSGSFVALQTQAVGNTGDPTIAIATRVITTGGVYLDKWTDGGGGSQSLAAIFGLLGGTTSGYSLGAVAGAFTFTGQTTALTENAGTNAFTLPAFPASFFITGGFSNSSYQFDAPQGVFAFTGQPVVLVLPGANFVLSAPAGSFNFTGLAVVTTPSVYGWDFSWQQMTFDNAGYLFDGTYPTAPTGNMPNCVGLELYTAIALLQMLGIFVPSKIGYFGTFPITVKWVTSMQMPGTILSQVPVYQANATINAPITFVVSEYSVAVAFP